MSSAKVATVLFGPVLYYFLNYKFNFYGFHWVWVKWGIKNLRFHFEWVKFCGGSNFFRGCALKKEKPSTDIVEYHYLPVWEHFLLLQCLNNFPKHLPVALFPWKARAKKVTWAMAYWAVAIQPLIIFKPGNSVLPLNPKNFMPPPRLIRNILWPISKFVIENDHSLWYDVRLFWMKIIWKLMSFIQEVNILCMR